MRRMEHIAAAIEHLSAAGLIDQTKMLSEIAHHMKLKQAERQYQKSLQMLEAEMRANIESDRKASETTRRRTEMNGRKKTKTQHRRGTCVALMKVVGSLRKGVAENRVG